MYKIVYTKERFIMKRKLVMVALVGLLLTAGLVLTVCFEPNCIGTGDCTITIIQGSSGLSIDYTADRSSCGDTTTSDSTGCIVADMNHSGSTNRRAGTHKCNC